MEAKTSLRIPISSSGMHTAPFGLSSPTNACTSTFCSNGLLDPWSGGGVLHSLSDSLVAVVIPNGAHHLDLRAANPADPKDLKAARQVEMKYISTWIAQYWHGTEVLSLHQHSYEV